MNTIRLHITGAGTRTPNPPKINIFGSWLPVMGFEQDALVQAIPIKDGMNFTLCNHNIRSYSELAIETKRQNGKLLSLPSHKASGLVMTGKILSDYGLKIGDILILNYRYGFLQAKKCDPTLLGFSESEHPQIFTVRSVKTKNNINDNAINGEDESLLPRIRLGSWIAEVGFKKDTVVSVNHQPNSLTFTLEPEGITQYRELVKKARANHSQLIQVEEDTHNGTHTPYLEINSSLLSRVGLKSGDVVITTHQYGQIRCKKIPFELLGFDPFV